MTRLLLAAVLMLPALSMAQSSIYKTTDEQGNVVFTDKPASNSKASQRIEVRPPNSTPPPPDISRPEPAVEIDEEEVIEYEVAISSPASESTIPMGAGNFSVNAAVKPRLEATQALQLFVDGIPQSDAQQSGYWALTNVFRGRHELTVSIIGQEGAVIASSEPTIVYVLRPSIK